MDTVKALLLGAGIALTVLSGGVGAIIASPTLGSFVTLALGTTLTSAGKADIKFIF